MIFPVRSHGRRHIGTQSQRCRTRLRQTPTRSSTESYRIIVLGQLCTQPTRDGQKSFFPWRVVLLPQAESPTKIHSLPDSPCLLSTMAQGRCIILGSNACGVSFHGLRGPRSRSVFWFFYVSPDAAPLFLSFFGGDAAF